MRTYNVVFFLRVLVLIIISSRIERAWGAICNYLRPP